MFLELHHKSVEGLSYNEPCESLQYVVLKVSQNFQLNCAEKLDKDEFHATLQ